MSIEVDSDVIGDVKLRSLPGAKIIAGPVTAIDKNEINFNVQATEVGTHEIIFQIADQIFTKEMVVGEGLVRISPLKPGADIGKMLMYPDEKPFAADSPVKSISLDYPDRISMTSGTDWWIVYFFVMSLVVALIFKPMLKVKI